MVMINDMKIIGLYISILALCVPLQFVESQQLSSNSSLSYADLTDLSIPAPIVADAVIKKATQMKGADAINIAPGHIRYYVEADFQKLIRGPAGLGIRQGYVVDVPLDSAGKAPKLKKQRVLIFARTVPNRPGILQLVAKDGQIAWSEDRDRLVRSILNESLKPGAAPALSKISRAFFVPGSVQGYSDTQIFVDSLNGTPISLNVRRRPGQLVRWGVALDDAVGSESMMTPRQDTLLWYRLACELPAQLPANVVEGGNERAVTEDYRVIRSSLGPCLRTRTEK